MIPVGDLMHALIKERNEETQALEDVVAAVRKLVAGELLAASFKAIAKAKLEEENKRMEEELEEIRMKQAVKDALSKQFMPSLNDSNRGFEGATDGLLQEDYNEEVRMTDMLRTKSESVDGTEKRLNAD